MQKSNLVLAAVAVLAGLVAGCATTSSVRVPRKNIEMLRNLNSVSVSKFECSDHIIAQAVQSMLIEELLGTNLSIVDDTNANVIIVGIITISSDQASSGGAFVGASQYSSSGGAYTIGTAGAYVSGITAQIVKDKKVLASVTYTQARTPDWVPDAPQVIGRQIRKRLRKILSR